jgi:catechol 2,3-dioxygenase-like lactoylglutathione lyase family enzyme
VDWKFEAVMLPVADIDRAKAFYEQAGFNCDVDHEPNEAFRVVQFTPPGSACSVLFGRGLGEDTPGTVRGMHLVVYDVEAACKELTARGIEVSEIHHFDNGERKPGPHPEHIDFGTYSSFDDPDGNGWVLQERRSR